MIVMLDTQIYDLIITDAKVVDGILRQVSSGNLEILTTHIQESELYSIPDPVKRELVLKIPRANVPTSDFVLDFSALDSARLGDGLTVNAIRSGGLKHTKDALIAATAESEGAVLVTEDKRLFRRSIEEQINVWSYTSFRQWLTESK